VPEYEAHFWSCSVCFAPNYRELKFNKFVFGLSVRIQFLLQVLGILDQRKCVGMWGATFLGDYLVERTRAFGSVGPTTVGDLGKAHRIHALVNNL
jgi:hypothetical protein